MVCYENSMSNLTCKNKKIIWKVSFVPGDVDVLSVETYWGSRFAFCQSIIRSPIIFFLLSDCTGSQSHKRLYWHCSWIFPNCITSCLFSRDKWRFVRNSFHYNTSGLLFLSKYSFCIIIKSISTFIFGKSRNAACSEFPAGFWKFWFPNFSCLSFSFLLAFIGISNVLRIFHELSFNFIGLICGDVFWFGPYSSVTI